MTQITTEMIQKEINDQRESLKEHYENYRDELNAPEEQNIADAIEECCFDSIDFNIGFEQGYIRGMEAILQLSK